MPTINRLKEVLAEEGRSSKWLATKLEKDPTTVSRWCNNHVQPSLETLDKIAMILGVSIKKLLNEK